MRKSVIALSLLGAVLGLASVPAEAAPRGPTQYFDDRGGFRGYAWCLQQGLEIFDCNYFNLAQCQVSASTRRVWCVQNPFAVVAAQRAEQAAAAGPVKRKKVRQQAY